MTIIHTACFCIRFSGNAPAVEMSVNRSTTDPYCNSPTVGELPWNLAQIARCLKSELKWLWQSLDFPFNHEVNICVDLRKKSSFCHNRNELTKFDILSEMSKCQNTDMHQVPQQRETCLIRKAYIRDPFCEYIFWCKQTIIHVYLT